MSRWVGLRRRIRGLRTTARLEAGLGGFSVIGSSRVRLDVGSHAARPHARSLSTRRRVHLPGRSHALPPVAERDYLERLPQAKPVHLEVAAPPVAGAVLRGDVLE